MEGAGCGAAGISGSGIGAASCSRLALAGAVGAGRDAGRGSGEGIYEGNIGGALYRNRLSSSNASCSKASSVGSASTKPSGTLDKLRSGETLLPALTNEVIEQTAKLFQVRRAWIEGTEEQIYDCHWCYKAPEHFFDELATFNMKSVTCPVVAFCSTPNLDGRSSRDQPIVIALVEKFADLDDEGVCRYRIYGDEWDWGYGNCRIQLKAMTRIVYKVFHVPVPMYSVSPDTLRAIESGYCVPRRYLSNRARLRNISLEDFALSPEESAQSKESEELARVLEYIRYRNLENIPSHND